MKNHKNKHNLMKTKIVLFFLLLSQIIFAQIIFTNNNIKYQITSISNSTVNVCGIANGYIGAITIPKTVENDGIRYEVISITSEAFRETGITSITLPN